MEEKVYLNDTEKIQVLELNNEILARQNEAMAIKERFMILNNLIPERQKELNELIEKLINDHGYKSGTIDNNYSIIPNEVK